MANNHDRPLEMLHGAGDVVGAQLLLTIPQEKTPIREFLVRRVVEKAYHIPEYLI